MRGSRDGGTGGRSDFFGNIRSLRLTGFGVSCEVYFEERIFTRKRIIPITIEFYKNCIIVKIWNNRFSIC